MQIVTFDEFVDLPEGTIFNYYNESDVFVGLWQKGKTIYDDDGKGIDYFQRSFLPQFRSHEGKYIIGDMERWGEFDEQNYAVYNNEDIQNIKKML